VKKWILMALVSMAAVHAVADGMADGSDNAMAKDGGAAMAQGAMAMPMSKAEFKGDCPVALVMMHKAVPGDPKFSSMFHGKTYYCGSAMAKAMFDKNPKKYLNAIAYSGHCALDLSKGTWMKGDPSVNSSYKGKIYVFCNAAEKAEFDKDPMAVVAMANKTWKMSKKM
jgi:YHS domain-containing protein